MMNLSPMRPSRRAVLDRWADTIAGVLILALVGVVAGLAGGALVLWARGLGA